jgi:hypothetical protein
LAGAFVAGAVVVASAIAGCDQLNRPLGHPSGSSGSSTSGQEATAGTADGGDNALDPAASESPKNAPGPFKQEPGDTKL